MNKETYELNYNEVFLNLQKYDVRERDKHLQSCLDRLGKYIHIYTPIIETDTGNVIGYVLTFKQDLASKLVCEAIKSLDDGSKAWRH